MQRAESGDKDFRPEEQGGYQSVQGKKMQKSKARALQRKSRQEAERERENGRAARAAGLRSTFSAARGYEVRGQDRRTGKVGNLRQERWQAQTKVLQIAVLQAGELQGKVPGS